MQLEIDVQQKAAAGGYACDIYDYEIRAEHDRFIPPDKVLELEAAGVKNYKKTAFFHNLTMPLLDYSLTDVMKSYLFFDVDSV